MLRYRRLPAVGFAMALPALASLLVPCRSAAAPELGAFGIDLKSQKPSVRPQDDFSAMPTGSGWIRSRFLPQIWQGKMRDALMATLLTSDGHSPNEFRVNGTLRNVDAFYNAFNVKPGDAMYLVPEERVRIW